MTSADRIMHPDYKAPTPLQNTLPQYYQTNPNTVVQPAESPAARINWKPGAENKVMCVETINIDENKLIIPLWKPGDEFDCKRNNNPEAYVLGREENLCLFESSFVSPLRVYATSITV